MMEMMMLVSFLGSLIAMIAVGYLVQTDKYKSK